ncbi:MAG TPA: hypothetical protein VGI96_19645 [Streptosporangiaceae bacterium]|jgi:hypothetical protein
MPSTARTGPKLFRNPRSWIVSSPVRAAVLAAACRPSAVLMVIVIVRAPRLLSWS